MNLTIWAILLTAAGVFILLNLLRTKEESRRRGPPQGGAPVAEDNPQARREPPMTDLDRFLQEVHRRRVAAEGEEPREDRPVRPVERVTIPPRRPTPTSTSRPSPAS